MTSYALGLDFGTNSCRSLIVDLENGRELATAVFDYPGGNLGIYTDPGDPDLARQNPADYLAGLEHVVKQAILKARTADTGFDPANIIGMGMDGTGSSPMPVDRNGTPLALLPEFTGNPDAMVWLWKDHTSHAEADEITSLAAKIRPEYLARCGGAYSSEWFWSKILHLKRKAPDVFKAAFSFVELCDWIPAVLTGNCDPLQMKRSVCAAGHKAMYAAEWGGLPDDEFLGLLDPDLADLRKRLYDDAVTSDCRAGSLSPEWAERLGLPAGIAVAAGALDAHMSAVGAGCVPGKLAKILGTSTCDLMVARSGQGVPDIPGVCGMVMGSVLPGCWAIEAGQSAVGDIFLWFVNHLVPERYGSSTGQKFAALEKEAAAILPGASGLLALDWNNGNRNVLADTRLSGLLLGQTLHTTAAEIYRALIEATAFGAKKIIERVREYRVEVSEIIACGGLASKNDLLMQIYSDILEMPISTAASEQTAALGAAIFGAVAAGAFPDAETAQNHLCKTGSRVFQPVQSNSATYRELYRIYLLLHDAFGTDSAQKNLNKIMKDLIAIREDKRKSNENQ